jgi:ComEC/Rec2-related protein
MKHWLIVSFVAVLLVGYGLGYDHFVSKAKRFYFDQCQGHSRFELSIVEVLPGLANSGSYIGREAGELFSILVEVPPGQLLSLGDLVSVEGQVSSLPKYIRPSYEKLRHLVGVIAPRSLQVIDHSSGMYWTLVRFRQLFLERLEGLLHYNVAALLGGVLVGDTSLLTVEIKDSFRVSGLSHVMAISGANMTLLMQCVFSFLRFLPKRLKLLVTALVLVGFTLFVGASAAVVRAGIMTMINLCALALEQYYVARQALYIVVLIVFFYSPYIVTYDIGFQLSCAATLGMIVYARPLSLLWGRLPWNIARETLSTTVAATSMTLPIAMFYFHTWYPLGMVVNLLLVPLFTVVTFLGYGVLVFSYVPFLGVIFTCLVDRALLWLLAMIQWGGDLSSMVVISSAWDLTLVLSYYAFLAFVYDKLSRSLEKLPQ